MSLRLSMSFIGRQICPRHLYVLLLLLGPTLTYKWSRIHVAPVLSSISLTQRLLIQRISIGCWGLDPFFLTRREQERKSNIAE